jgi:hypothetical protein
LKSNCISTEIPLTLEDPLKVTRTTSVFIITVVLGSLFLTSLAHATRQHGFSIPQYEQFHDVLHPLEHDALPNKDFRRIRNKAPELIRRGKAIVAVGIPAGTNEQRKAEFAGELKKFDKALSKLRIDARKGSNTKLKTSYSAVHDSFEMLAAMLPRG